MAGFQMWRLAAVGVVFAGSAQAGAWMREPGDVFLAPSYTIEQQRGRTSESTYAGLFAEWGVAPSLTLGLDLGRPALGDPTAVIFARLPIAETAQGIRVAGEIGIGLRDGPGSSTAFLRPGLSIGYGFGSRIGNGWVALDVSAQVDDGGDFDTYKADLTAGMSFTSRFKAMMQLHHELIGGLEQDTFVPSLVWRTRERQHIQLGLMAGRGSRRTEGIKIGLWQEF